MLSGALDAAGAGRGTILLVSGEPGIGKTRLADELSARAEARDMLVCWGRCWEGGGAPPFWPWIQVLRSCVRSIDPAPRDPASRDPAARDPAAREAVAPGRLDLASELGFPAGMLASQSEHARFVLFDAVTRFLADAARGRPLLIVLDDVHAADPASLLLLQFVARALRETRIVILVTHREAEIREDAERAGLLAEVAREGTALPVRGLDAGQSASLIEAVGGARPSPVLATSLHEVTSGNPLFLDELVRLMVSEDPGAWTERQPPFALPVRVRVAVRRRLDALPAAALEVLEVASVIGLEFDTRLIGHVLAVDGAEVVAQLGVPAAARVVGPVAGRPERHRFAHALVREVLYENLSPTRRAALHRTVGEALEIRLAGRVEAVLPALANHFELAGSAAHALDYAERAGRQALAQVAYEDAVAYLERALRLLDATGSTDDRRRVALLQALGEAQRRSGDVEAGRRTLHEAARLAGGLGDAQLFARVVLAFGWSFALGRPEQERVALLEDALRGLDREASPLRARVLGTLAVALYWDAEAHDRMLALSEEAVDLARRVGEASTLGHVLHCRRWVRGVELSPEESLSATSEVLGLAEQVGDGELVLQCRRWRVADLITLGEIDRAWREIESHDALADRLRLPLYQWYSAAWKAMRALLEGRFDDAERDAAEAYRIGARAEPSNAEATYTGHMLYLRLQQGRVDELLPALRTLAREGTPAPAFRAGLIWLLAEAGMESEARPLLAQGATAGLPAATDKSALYALASLADACALLGDSDQAATLYQRLEPYAGRVMAIEPSFIVGGAVDRSLGVLATTMRRWADAENRFEAALRLNERLRARPWTARTQQEYAAMLAERDGVGDRARAHALAEMALATARELGMTSIAERSERVLARLGSEEPEPPIPAAAAASAYLRREGQYWTIGYQNEAIRLRATTGLQYLARLLRSPGTELHALDLVTGDGGGDSVPDGGDAGPILDPQARTAYRARLADIDAELAEAEAANDLGRRERLQDERDVLAHELAVAVGLWGRERRAGSAAERARLNVTRAIKTALTHIADAHRELGLHLSRTVRTGTYCSYKPDPRAPLEWAE